MKGIARNLIAYGLGSVWTIGCALLSVLTSPFASRKLQDWHIRNWSRTVCKLTGVDLHVEGLENVDPQASYVMVSNHLSAIDIPVLFAAIPISFRMAAKAELFSIPIFGHAMKMLGFFPVYRGHPTAATSVLQRTAQDLALNGRSVWFAPEGTRFIDEVGPFKKGAFALAVNYQKPILPICIYGADRVMNKNSWVISGWQWKQRVFVRILPPMAVDPASKNEVVRLMQESRSLVVQNFEDLRAREKKVSS